MKFSEYPKEVNGFKRQANTSTQHFEWNYVAYERGNDLGYVTGEDLAAGKLQVRKVDQVKPGDGTRKVAVPSNRIW